MDPLLLFGTAAMVGKTISHYTILDKIGEGGMGVVYKAEDTRLDRTVALKFLSSHLLESDEARERFVREAKAAATLDHPNICTVYEIDEADGQTYLSMAYIEGPTLKQKIDERPLKLKQALDIAIEIAEGLAAAHEHGINHRDIKPANLMLGADGHIKIMDFGLAHLGGRTKITKSGVVLGTPSYMAPEQVRGEETDRRADIWAFGVVLHEMITGQPPFGGETDESLSYAVLHVEPEPLTALRSGVPVDLDRIVAKLLAKDPEERYQHIDEALVDLRALRKRLPETTGTRTAAVPAAAVSQSWLPWLVAVVATFVALAVSIAYFRQAPPELQAVQLSVEPPPGAALTNVYSGYAPSPDGRYVVFSARGEGETTQSLWLRPLDSGTARRLAGTEGGDYPTWSPDSRSLAFYADGQLRRIEITGGAALTLGEATDDAVTPTGTWNRDGVILFGSATGLHRVSASGGGATPVTKVDSAEQETGHGYPQFLSGGDRFLYFVASADPNVRGVYASSLGQPGQRNLIVRTGAKAVYVPPRAAYPGYLLWLQDRALVAQHFDPKALEFEGNPVSVAEGILRVGAFSGGARAAFWASEAGLLTYFAEGALTLRRIVWMSRAGVELGEIGPEDAYSRLALAPDGERMAVSIDSAVGASGRSNIDIWVRELASGRMTRLTSDPAQDNFPTWSPDGTQIAFASNREGGVWQVYRQDGSGVGEAERLTEGPNEKAVYDWSRDGRFLLGFDSPLETGWDAMVLPLEGDRTPIPVAQTRFSEDVPNISPDGRWVAYHADYSGRFEIYVRAFPGADGAPQGRWMISNNGGHMARWRDGGELYYQSLDGDLMAVTIEAGPRGIRAGTPRELLTGLQLRTASKQFDFTPDGKRFLLILPSAKQQERQRLTVVTNFQAVLSE